MNQPLFIRVFCLILSLWEFSACGQISRQDDLCGAFEVVDVGIGVYGYQPDTQNGLTYYNINASELRKGFMISLRDTSFKVYSFVIAYSSKNRFSKYTVIGPQVNQNNARLLKGVEEGDLLSVECVTVIKKGKMSSSTSVWINVIQ